MPMALKLSAMGKAKISPDECLAHGVTARPVGNFLEPYDTLTYGPQELNWKRRNSREWMSL
jgi:hypothetical protein